MGFLLTMIQFTMAHDHVMKKGFVQEQITDQLVNPTCLVITSDRRIFITEKGGTIRIYQDGELLAEPFISLKVDQHGERGLGSVALDPDFDQNGHVYVYYSVYNTNFNRLSRFTANGNKAIPGSEKILMDFNKMNGTIHNSGAMRFANDGTLFITIGDGVVGQISQNLNSRLGKVIRLNKDGSIPTDNPMYNELSGENRAIYAYGLRNSFTADYNSETGTLLANDVGLSDWEEINEIKPGKNYGWPLIEGFRTEEDPPKDYSDPLFVYPHSNVDGCAIVGGAFYTPDQPVFPTEYLGKYFFSDYCTGVVRSLNPENGEVEDTIMTGADFLSNMVVSEWGDLYYLSFSLGELNRISYIGDGSPFIAKQPKDVLAVVGENATFEIEAYGDDLEYQWYKSGEKLLNNTTNVLTQNDVKLADSAALIYCLLTNAKGTIYTDTAQLLVTQNQRPVVSIDRTRLGDTYKMGGRLHFSGGAVDPEDGVLDASRLQWKIDFHHNLHFHPGMPKTNGIDSGSIFIPRTGETDTNVWYRVHLKATDNQGLTQEEFLDVRPEIGSINVKTFPFGLDVSLDGTLDKSPYSKPAVFGNQRVLTAAPRQLRNDSLFEFVEWENGSTENNRTIVVETTNTYTAHYSFTRLFVEGHGDGLLGKYYKNVHFQSPVFIERIDPIIDFFWNWSSPLGSSQPNEFVSIHWSGSVLAPITSMYAFTADFDDACRLKIADAVLIDRLDESGEKVRTNSIYLEAGSRYNIDIWYQQFRYSSRLKLLWEFEDLGPEILPQSFLYSSRSTDSLPPNLLPSEFQVFPTQRQVG